MLFVKGEGKMSGLSVTGFLNGVERNPFKAIRDFVRSCQCAWERVRYGFCYRDIWDIEGWFISVMPGMLSYLRDNRYGSPDILKDAEVMESLKLDDEGDCHEAWTRVLNHMIFLLHEMDDKTCSRKNPYEEEYDRCSEEFEKEYGFFGEKLRTPEEKEEEAKGFYAYHMMSEVPKYKDISEAFFEEERKRDKYQIDCKNEFFKLFTKYFYDLWD